MTGKLWRPRPLFVRTRHALGPRRHGASETGREASSKFQNWGGQKFFLAAICDIQSGVPVVPDAGRSARQEGPLIRPCRGRPIRLRGRHRRPLPGSMDGARARPSPQSLSPVTWGWERTTSELSQGLRDYDKEDVLQLRIFAALNKWRVARLLTRPNSVNSPCARGPGEAGISRASLLALSAAIRLD